MPLILKRREAAGVPSCRRMRIALKPPSAATQSTNTVLRSSIDPYGVCQRSEKWFSRSQAVAVPAPMTSGAHTSASGWKEFTSALTAASVLVPWRRRIAGIPAKSTMSRPPIHSPAAATCTTSSTTLATKCSLDAE